MHIKEIHNTFEFVFGVGKLLLTVYPYDVLEIYPITMVSIEKATRKVQRDLKLNSLEIFVSTAALSKRRCGSVLLGRSRSLRNDSGVPVAAR